MARIVGRLTSLGVGKETTRGTAVAPAFWIPVRDLDFDDAEEVIDNTSGFGVIDEIQDQRITQEWAEGSFGGKVYDVSEGALLGRVFGQSPTSTQRGVSGVYDHTFNMLNSNQHSSMTVAIDEANYDGRYAMGMVNSYELTAALDDYAARTVDLVAKRGVTATNTPSYTNENEFVPKNISLSLATTEAGLDGASTTEIRGVTLTINKNVERMHVLGQTTPSDILNKQMGVEGSFDLYYNDRVFHDFATANTRRAMRISLKNTDVDIGATHNPELRFDMPEVVFRRPERGWGNDDISTLTVNFRAVFNLTGAKTISARLTSANTGANY